MNKEGAIGVYDSGIGGLTVVRELFSQLPGEKIVYVGDTAHVPYGSRSEAELVELTRRIIRFLLAKGAKIIVSACNTTSSVAIPQLEKEFPVPLVDVIRPGARGAVAATRNGKVGVIATEATVRSGSYQRAIRAIEPSVEVYAQACPRLVPLVEKGILQGPEVEEALREYLQPLQEKGIDTLVLGCTHYPFLQPVINALLGPGVAVVDPARETVAEAARLLREQGLIYADTSCYRAHEFYFTGPADSFEKIGRSFVQLRDVEVKKAEI